MFKNYLKNSVSTLALFMGVYAANAQSSLVTNGASVNVSATAKLIIPGSCTNNNGTINNAGAISLKGNLTQSGTGAFNATGAGVVSFAGSTAQSVQSVSNLDLKNLVVNNNAKLSLNANLTVSNSVNLSNNSGIELGNFNLNIGNGSVSNYGANSYIITNGTGALKTTLNVGDNELLPVGNAAYNPIRLVSNAGASDVFSVAVADDVKDAGNGGASFPKNAVDNTWNISEAVTGGNDVNITLEWDASQELPLFDRTKSAVMHWNGASWDVAAFAAATSAGGTRWSRTIANRSSFSPFGVADNKLFVPLPVQLIAFTGYNQNAKNILQWATANEVNNLGFELERSTDGREFQKIGFVAGKINSTQTQTYDFVDNQPAQGLNYYRFKQKDTDGRFSFSNVVTIYTKQTQIIAYPNPTQDLVTLSGINIEQQTAKLYTVAGQAHDVQIVNNQMDIAHLPSGIYFLKLTTGDAVQITLKITKS